MLAITGKKILDANRAPMIHADLATCGQSVVGSEAPAPECYAIPENGEKSSWGGARPGAGRPRKVSSPPAIADTVAWRVFATWSQAEVSSARELARQGYDVYLAMIAVRRRDRVIPSLWHEIRVPLFAGYGFIRLTQAESREPIFSTRGVRELLRRPDGRLSTIADRVVDRLRGEEPARLRLPKEHGPILGGGTPVRLMDGPFAGHFGVVLDCDGVRTQIKLTFFGRATPVWIDRTSVEPVEAAAIGY